MSIENFTFLQLLRIFFLNNFCFKNLHISQRNSSSRHFHLKSKSPIVSVVLANQAYPANMSSDPKFDSLHKQLFDEGLKMRRSVVGDEYVDRALANGSTEFSRAGQELVTEFCWGYAWTRPGLDKKQRSLINIGMLMALNRAPELAVHIRGARNNGLTELEIREAIIHATTYCGVPAGVDAMKTAEKVLNDMAEKGEHARELGSKDPKA